MDKIPTADDCSKLIKGISVENIEIDENGHYDPKQSPDFHDWMVNG
ncbi:AbrB family transcriptional regulator [Lactobacillus corticis]|uniref:SpoVT / AbrB like domain protein n=1 Tax=Lactobacillus corticis TaxID=2201249 RepID=A0A916VIH3_9LACO|nr:AbrB family transcriptional regulator [Lactobacillus corticis]GFZ27375.1 SpoVT / AbrB like domain protein [Lactobacillus corticis]